MRGEMEKQGHMRARCTQTETWSSSCPHSEAREEPSTNLGMLLSPLGRDAAAGRAGGGEASCTPSVCRELFFHIKRKA